MGSIPIVSTTKVPGSRATRGFLVSGLGALHACCTSKGEERLPQCPAARSGPGVVVESDVIAEHLSVVAVEHGPRHHKVACRITDRAATEVDHGAEPTVAGQQVRRRHITMHPYRRSGPRRRCSAERKSPRSAAKCSMSTMRLAVACRPGSHRYTDHGLGNPTPGAPNATGEGIGSGSEAARTGSQRCSLSICAT